MPAVICAWVWGCCHVHVFVPGHRHLPASLRRLCHLRSRRADQLGIRIVARKAALHAAAQELRALSVSRRGLEKAVRCTRGARIAALVQRDLCRLRVRQAAAMAER